jgi:hypothetical protein
MWVIVESVSPRMSGLYDLERDGGPATFSELAQKAGSLARGPDSWPTTKSVFQAANPVDRAVRRNLCAHMRTHECGLGGCSTPNRIFCVSSIKRRQVSPGKTRKGRRTRVAQNIRPLWRRLSYCVSFMQQGKVQESVAHPPNHHHPFPCHPNRPPNARPVLSASVG